MKGTDGNEKKNFNLGILSDIDGTAGCSAQKAEPKSYQKPLRRREPRFGMPSQRRFSATVAIMDNGNIAHQEGFAIINRATGLAVSEDTQFNICSVSKVFTAAAILQLCEDGKLELDQPVVEYMPEFPPWAGCRYKDITVRMLLNHTAAFPGTYTNTSRNNRARTRLYQKFSGLPGWHSN